MQLHELIYDPALTLAAGSAELDIRDITDDSRLATPGCLFVARAGNAVDGRSFIADALKRGALAVIAEPSVTLEQWRTLASVSEGASGGGVALVHAAKVDQALCGRLAERFFGHPSRQVQLVGITGTKGKTTTAYLVQQLLQAAGYPTGMIGTICIDDGKTRTPANLTTPGAIDFSRYLARMVRHGCRAAVAEFSSHALHQGRVAGLKTDVGVFTNLTGEHLDYHGTMDAYADAKAILFAGLSPEAFAVVNLDAPYAERMLRDCPAPVIGCTLGGQAIPSQGVQLAEATILELAAAGSRVTFSGPWGEFTATLAMAGRHNVMNALEALAAAWVISRAPAAALRDALEACLAPPGRLEPVRPATTTTADAGEPAAPTVLVDYAHTDDALDKTLEALRPLTKGRLCVMFGCGGDRDRTKRPRMAAVACQRADVVVLTSDNPRTEDPGAILRDILAGVPRGTSVTNLPENPAPPLAAGTGPAVYLQPDRAAAIAWTIAQARPGDVVLLAGKGHEDYQIIGATKRPFDDREHARQALAVWGKRKS